MKLREIADLNKSKVMISNFLGYNKQARIGDGENHDELNLTSDYYPFLSTRKRRTQIYAPDTELPEGATIKNIKFSDDIYALVDASSGEFLDLYNIDKKQTVVYNFCGTNAYLITFGAYLLSVETHGSPTVGNYKEITNWYNTSNGEYGSALMDNLSVSSYHSCYICDENGAEIHFASVGDAEPSESPDGVWWYDTRPYTESADDDVRMNGIAKKYYSYNQGWFEAPTYIRIALPRNEDVPKNALGGIKEGDRIKLDKMEYLEDIVGGKAMLSSEIYNAKDKSFEVVKVFEQTDDKQASIVVDAKFLCATYYKIEGADFELGESSGTVTKRGSGGYLYQPAMPKMDFMFESANRIWGCRFGKNNKGDFVNEIYASQLGKFNVFDSFKFIDSDSYIVSCGTPEKFTGGCDYNGNPVFFKENYMHRVYGNYPFQVTPYKCNGVKDGSWRSLAIVDNVLYFHSRVGVSYYDGSLPHDIGFPFGEETFSNVIASGNNAKYFMYCGNNKLFVYDVVKRILHKESGIVKDMTSDGDKVFAIMQGNPDILYCISHCPEEFSLDAIGESGFDWNAKMCITGLDIANEKYVSQIQIRFDYGRYILDMADFVEVGVEYNRSGEINWVWRYPNVGTAISKEKNSFTVPIRVRRCDTMTLHLRGHGQMKIQSIAKVIEEGSDATRLAQV